MNKRIMVLLLVMAAVFVLESKSADAAKPSDFGLRDGDLISAIFSDDPDVYIVNEQGYKRLFLNPEIFNFYGHLGGFANVKLVTPQVRDAFITSGFFRNCEIGDEKVFGVETVGEDVAQLRWVNTSGEQAAQDDPEFFKKVFCINQREFNWYTQGDAYHSVREVPPYTRLYSPSPYPSPYPWPSPSIFPSPTPGSMSNITVLAPNGGEIFTRHQSQTLTWLNSSQKSVNLYILPSGYLLAENVPWQAGDKQAYVWQDVGVVPGKGGIDIPDGQHYLQVCPTDVFSKSQCDASNGAFSIVSSPTVATLYLSLDPASPAPGTTVNAGQSRAVLMKMDLKASGGDAKFSQISVCANLGSIVKSTLLSNITIRDDVSGIDLGSIPYFLYYDLGRQCYWGSVNFSPVTIPANYAKVVSVLADVSAAAPAETIKAGVIGMAGDAGFPKIVGLDVWGNNLNIVPQTAITVLSPNGGEIFAIGKTYDITWTPLLSSNAAPNVVISLWKSGFNEPWLVLDSVPQSSGRYTWTVPSIPNLTGNDFKIQVQGSVGGVPVTDRSDAPFTITGSSSQLSITVHYPNGGENFNLGQVITVAWSSTNIDTVEVFLDPASGPVPAGGKIATLIDYGDGKQVGQVSIPSSIAVGQYRLRLQGINQTLNTTIGDVSDAPFTISTADPSYTAWPDRTSGNAPLSVLFTVNLKNYPSCGVQYEWNFGDGPISSINESCSSSSTVLASRTVTFAHSYSQAGTFPVWVRINGVPQSFVQVATINVGGLTSNTTPVGYNDGQPSAAVTQAFGWPRESIMGWAYDADAPATSIDVHLYYGPRDDNTGPGCTNGCQGFAITANVARDLSIAGITQGNHGFLHSIPAQYRDGKPYRVRAYAINTPTGTNPLLPYSGAAQSHYDFQIATTTATLNRTLAIGMAGDDVKTLQKFLINRGLLSANLATGYFGTRTEAAVKGFQWKNNIVATGIVGNVTASLLRVLIGR